MRPFSHQDRLAKAPGGGWRDVVQGAAGVAVMVAALLTPFSRGRRGRWGAAAEAARRYPGDELVPEPRWGWTHAIGIDAPAESVWPWVAQIGADRGGFYSYQWLENLIGCQVRNAATIHPQWAAREGGELRLHPKAPPLRIVTVQPGRALVTYLAPVPAMSSTRQAESPHPGGPARKKDRWMTASWLFLVEPAGPGRCRVISRYRCDTSHDLPSRLQFGPAIIEPVSFAMDRRMLIGIKQRAEQARDTASRPLPSAPGLLAGMPTVMAEPDWESRESAGPGQRGRLLPALKPVGRLQGLQGRSARRTALRISAATMIDSATAVQMSHCLTSRVVVFRIA